MNLNFYKRDTNIKCLFVDRDGVINYDYGHVYKINDFVFKKEIFKIFKLAKDIGFKIIIVTNQGGIGRGIYSAIDFKILTNYMLKKFEKKNIKIDDVFFCPFHPEKGIGIYKKNSFFRKPNSGMLIHAINKHNINIDKSLMVGDNESDKQASLNAGILKYIDVNDQNWIDQLFDSLKLINDL